MNKAAYIVIGGLTGLIVLLGGLLVTHQSSPPQSAPAQTYGSLAGPDIPFPYLQWGGVYAYNAGPSITATSSVLCSIQNTVGTSTLDMAGIRFDSNGMGSQTFDISTSSSQLGSSTIGFVIGATIGATPTSPTVFAWTPGDISTSSTALRILGSAANNNTNGTTLFMWNTGDWLTFRIATATPGTFAAYATGQCSVRTTKL